MSSTPFGEHLKREREMRGVSLEEIAAATRISTRFLAALESEQWAELPGGVFNRGFIRSVARYLGLDEDALVAEYVLETKGQPEPRTIALQTPSAMPRSWQPAILAAVALVVIIIGGWFAFRHFEPWIALHLHAHPTAPASGDSH